MLDSQIADDLAQARALAEQGRAAPLLSGGFFLGYGLLLCAAWGAHYAMLKQIGVGPGLGAWLGSLWAGFGVCSVVMNWGLRRRLQGRPGRGSTGNRGDRAMWTGVGFALLAIIIGALLRMILFRDFAAPNTILPAAFALYGAAMIGSASLSGERLLLGFGAASIAVSCVAGIIAYLPEMYLLGACAALVVLGWPGILLIRREPAVAA